MKRPNSPEQHQRETAVTAWVPVLAAVGIMLTGALSTLAVLEMDVFRPAVGDLVVFRPGSQDDDAWQVEVPATDVVSPVVTAGHCTLNPNVMATDGGSLVVEGRQNSTPPLYRLHWAGRRTAQGAADCGAQADVTISRVDLQKLANAAGGFGVGDKGVVR